MTDELFEKIQNFERKHAEFLIEWLELVRAQRSNFTWSPDNRYDEYAMKLYEISCKHDSALREFEKKADMNILCTYLKYHGGRKSVIYPFSFNYSEPDIDLVMCP